MDTRIGTSVHAARLHVPPASTVWLLQAHDCGAGGENHLRDALLRTVFDATEENIEGKHEHCLACRRLSAAAGHRDAYRTDDLGILPKVDTVRVRS